MRFYSIINELFYRSLYFSLSFFFTWSLFFYYSNEWVYYVLKLSSLKDFIFTNLTESFYASFLLCCLLTSLMHLPICGYQFSCYISGSLFCYEHQNLLRLIWRFIFIYFVVLFMLLAFGLPTWNQFFVDYQIQSPILSVTPQIRVWPYIVLIAKLCLFLFISQLILLWFITYIGVAQNQFNGYFPEKRNWQIFIYLILSSLIAPPDLSIQISLTLILCILSESVILYHCYVFTSEFKRSNKYKAV